MKRSEERLLFGPAAILSLRRASELLPIADHEARELIEDAGIIRRLAGRRVVVWSDCIALCEFEQERQERSSAPPVRLKRSPL